MSQVRGIAGVFLYTNDPPRLAQWYARAFGLEFRSESDQTSYVELWHRDDGDASRRWSTVFAIMPARKPLASERSACMINFRVDDLHGVLAHLQALGVNTGVVQEQRDGRTPDSTGWFTRIEDPEGNPLELYQPKDA